MTTSGWITLVGLVFNAAGASLQLTAIENHVTIGVILSAAGTVLAGYGYVSKTVAPPPPTE